MKKFVIIVFFVLIGCAPKYSVVQGIDNKNANTPLPKDSSAYISVPEDFTSGEHLYVGSGREVAANIELLFSKNLNSVVIGLRAESCQQGLASAKANGYDYYICPQLLQWDDYATDWSGIPDRLKLKVYIMSTEPEEIIDKILIDGIGRVVTFEKETPMVIAKEPMENWVNSLF